MSCRSQSEVKIQAKEGLTRKYGPRGDGRRALAYCYARRNNSNYLMAVRN